MHVDYKGRCWQKFEEHVKICGKHPLSNRCDSFVCTMVWKSHINVTKTSNLQTSNCLLIIKGINPQQQTDLCTDYCENLTLIDTHSNTEPVPATGEFSVGAKQWSVYICIVVIITS